MMLKEEKDMEYGLVKCRECGVTLDCVDIETELCPECSDDIAKCEACKYPCRTPQEKEKARIKREGRVS